MGSIKENMQTVYSEEYDFDKFKTIFKRFYDGLKWFKLYKGTDKDNSQVRKMFKEDIAKHLLKMWCNCPEEDKKWWGTVKEVVDLFDGTIVG